MKSQVLLTVWRHISCEAAGEFWHWSLSGVKGLKWTAILTQGAHISCQTSNCWSLYYIWQSSPPLPPFSPPLLACLYNIGGVGGRGKRWGRLSNMAEWPTIACPTRDNTSLGLNNLHPNISVHNSCMGSLWCEQMVVEVNMYKSLFVFPSYPISR